MILPDKEVNVDSLKRITNSFFKHINMKLKHFVHSNKKRRKLFNVCYTANQRDINNA